MRHEPVLLQEVLDALALDSGKHIIDGTLGDAGHAEQILERTGPDGTVLGIDVDAEAILRAKKFLHRFGERAIFVRDNFANVEDIVTNAQFGPVHGILLDLGWSTPQFEERGRGLSFAKAEEPLDMRLGGATTEKTAEYVVNEYNVDELSEIFEHYGEEPQARLIAEAIVESRAEERIKTVGELVEIILATYRKKLKTDKEIPWIGGLHPATKVFQALRIEVNDELHVIKSVLPQAIDVLESGGRLAVISFHSLEDRIVKHYFKKEQDRITILTKKPIVCGEEEHHANPRARSAKLRVIEKK